MINLIPEMIEKAKTAKTAEELLEIAKANNIEMTEDEAKTYFAQLSPKCGELSDDDLDAVAGGACSSNSNIPAYGTKVRVTNGSCPKCGTNVGVVGSTPVGYGEGIGVICEKCSTESQIVVVHNNISMCSYEIIG